ncbi:hypothetical protein M2322_004228 [Rhodoblastus acidophilus]|uniref:hypothetical protein n=1 Tax=Rhodoblastus acidophilus TaxID=1074 RepID=UPI0031CA4916|nr:hypothetical protein [Rhodoblastus acidophilus]
MTPEQIFKALSKNDDEFPEAALHAALQQRDALAPMFEAEAERLMKQFDEIMDKSKTEMVAIRSDRDWGAFMGDTHWREFSGRIRRRLKRVSEFPCDGHLETNGGITWRDGKPRLFPIICLTSFWPARIPRRPLRKMVFSTN